MDSGALRTVGWTGFLTGLAAAAGGSVGWALGTLGVSALIVVAGASGAGALVALAGVMWRVTRVARDQAFVAATQEGLIEELGHEFDRVRERLEAVEAAVVARNGRASAVGEDAHAPPRANAPGTSAEEIVEPAGTFSVRVIPRAK